MFEICFDNTNSDMQLETTKANVETLEDAENIALFYCRIGLLSNKIMLNSHGDLSYDIMDGLQAVGQVEIKSG